MVCHATGCAKDMAYALLKDGKVHRITFSRSLAEYINSMSCGDF